MFSSSIRKRQEWAAIVPSLKTSSSAWKETTLDACDITFPVTTSDVSPVVFRAILSSLSDLQSLEGKARVERLSLMNGGKHIAVMLLLDAENSIETFSRIQAELLHSDSTVPIIPISTTQELPSCLEALRRDYTDKISPSHEDSIAHKDLACWCVDGKPLTRDQVNILTGITSGFRDLASHSTQPVGQAAIREYLGDQDGGRIISFFTNGSSHI
ncbi:hypothetical protein FSARC_6818 [Fusarium sarcochroum]|uniref:Uncharacterized protein n=1 Tax=Fusarium sarcochroum TaxID=1208366 RepID=A0A8H4X8L5_9HYPO|nr:hypothetical protein FSARC_6818 [Fusarium sarcochroum]